MKTYLSFTAILLTAVVFNSCTMSEVNISKSTRTSISGMIEGGENQQLFINKINGNRGVVIDTIAIGEDGSFKHSVNQPLKLDYYIISNGKRSQIQLITDSTEVIVLNAKYTDLSNPDKLEGSTHSQVYTDFSQIIKEGNSKIEALNKQIEKAATIEEKKEIGTSKKAARLNLREDMSTFIDENASSPGISAFLNNRDFTKEPELAQKTINHLAKSAANTSYYKLMASQVKKYANPATAAKSADSGTVAPNIKLNDPDGVERTLYDLRGKVVLIDFWASWCGPCRKENPNVVKAYNKYKSSGFEVMSVSLDSDKKRWVDAIKQDGLIWDNHVSDLKKWDTPYKTIYNFSGIPHTVLVDRDGNIIQSKIRGAALEEKLEDIFGF